MNNEKKVWRDIADYILAHPGGFSSPEITDAVGGCGPDDVRVVLRNMECLDRQGEIPGERALQQRMFAVKLNRQECCPNCRYSRQGSHVCADGENQWRSRLGLDLQ